MTSLTHLPVRAHRRPRGRVSPKNLCHLIELSHARHGAMLKAVRRVFPAAWDSRSRGWVGSVKDQQQCGSCYIFSGTGVCEVAYNKGGTGGGADVFKLSEEYTLECGRNDGCDGGDNTSVLDWAKTTGLPLTAEYGDYTSGDGDVAKCRFKPGMKLYKIKDWGFANSDGGSGMTPIDDIKAAIMEYGAVGAAVAADDAFEAWGDNSPSFNSPFQGSGSEDVDHDIMLVGWHDDAAVKGGGYWILRNSWGPDWGVGGYMAIAYGVNCVGTESVFGMLDVPAVVDPVVLPVSESLPLD